MPFQHWQSLMATTIKPKSSRQSSRLWGMGGLALAITLLIHPPASAQSMAEMSSPSGFLSLVCVAIGLLAGSILIIESRRWITFLLGLLLTIALSVAIALIGNYYGLLPKLQFLWPPAAAGLGISIVVVGLWWWGQRQGYGQALAIALFCRKRKDSVLTRIIKQYEEPNTQLSFWEKITYRAAAVRYRRMVNRHEINTLYTLIQRQLQKDGRKERAARRAKQQQQKRTTIDALLAEADELCQSPDPTGAIPQTQVLNTKQ